MFQRITHGVHGGLAADVTHILRRPYMLAIRQPRQNVVRRAGAFTTDSATSSVPTNRGQAFRRLRFQRQEPADGVPRFGDAVVVDGVDHEVDRLRQRGLQPIPHTADAVNNSAEERLKLRQPVLKRCEHIVVNPLPTGLHLG